MGNERKEHRQSSRRARREARREAIRGAADQAKTPLLSNGDDSPYDSSHDYPVTSRLHIGQHLKKFFHIADPPAPTMEDVKASTVTSREEDGEVVYIRPYATGKWTAKYFTSTRYHNFLATATIIWMPLIEILMIVGIVTGGSTVVYITSLALVILAVFHCDMALRLTGRAINHRVVPDIPYITPVLQTMLYDIDVEEVSRAKQENAKKKTRLQAQWVDGIDAPHGSFAETVQQWVKDNGVNGDDVEELSEGRLTSDDILAVVDGGDVTPKFLLGMAKMSGQSLAQWRDMYAQRRQ